MKVLRMHIKLIRFLIMALFAVVAIYGGYSIITYGNRWFASNRNPRVRAERKNVIMGDVSDRNDMLVASTNDGERIYQTDTKTRRALVHVLGDSDGNVANGVETFQAGLLLGFEKSLMEQVLQMLRAEPKRGDNLKLTIDAKLSAFAAETFKTSAGSRGKNGAVVVMNYKTGELLCEISLPDFDPYNVRDVSDDDPSRPFWNRAVQSAYPPGSTFKIVTATTAIDNMADALTHTWDCGGSLHITSFNRFITDAGMAKHGTLTLKRAFAVSCNNTFARIALDVGDDGLRRSAEAFGFNDNFLFRDLVVENSTYPTTGRNDLEIAWSGAGQSRVAASPLHMCMLAAAVANDGVMMEPALILRAFSENDVTRYEFTPRVYRRAISAEMAETLTSFMREVVTNGTGTRSRVSGLTICGKTGSAETSMDGDSVTHGWYVGFIDDPATPYAISVIVESVNSGDGGGSTAAPIAGAIFEYLQQMGT